MVFFDWGWLFQFLAEVDLQISVVDDRIKIREFI
jgi:hypothetical protein